jgi:hypothetical protein
MMTNFSTTPATSGSLLVQFRDESAGAAWWNWDFGDGGTSVFQNPLHLYKEFGQYEVCLTAGNPVSSETHCDSISLLLPGSQQINNAVLYPNPAEDQFSIKIQNKVTRAEMRITDIYGRAVLQRNYTDQSAREPFTTDVSDFPRGIYLVQVNFDDYSKTWKIVID